MSDYVFPQFNDYDDPQNFAFHLGQSNLGDFVEYGLGLTADHTNEDFDVSEGKAYVQQSSAVGDASGETRHRLNYGIHVDARSNIPFATTSGVNYIFLDANLGTQDSPDIVVKSTDSPPSDASIKLGEIDAGADTAAVEVNREPDISVYDIGIEGGLTTSLDLAGHALEDSVGDIVLGDPFDLAGNALTDSSQDYLDLTGDGNDLRLATGQAIEDGSGNQRLNMPNTSTTLKDESGSPRVTAVSGGRVDLTAGSGETIRFKDANGNFFALTYTTSASAPGTLELTNASLDASNNDITNAKSISTTDVSIGKTAGVGGPNGTAVTVSSGGTNTTNIPINTTTIDDFGGFDTTNDRYVVQKDGKYRVMAKSTWHNVPSGSYIIRTAIRVNNNFGGQSGDYNTGLPNGDGTKNYTTPHADRIFDLVSGDVIEATVTQFSGTSIDMSGDLYATRVEVEYLG